MPLSDVSFTALHKDGTLITDLLSDVSARQPDWRVGAALRLPRHRLPYCIDRVSAWAPFGSYVLADPETRQMLLPFARRGMGRNDHAYLQESDPAANRDRFIGNTLRAQVSVGSQVLISPWLVHGVSGIDRELKVTIDLAHRSLAHKLAEDRTVLVGIEATEAVFANQGARDRMLDEVVALDGAPIYLRMTTPPNLTGRGQYQNAAALQGMRAAVESLVDNEHQVVLAQSGLMGWLMLGFGAQAFGAGVSGSLQRSPMPVATSGGGGQPPLQWYLLPQFMGFVRADEMQALSGVSGFVPCDCPYCAGAIPQAGPGFDRVSADKHFLWQCARLAEEVRVAPDRKQVVRDQLAVAERFWTSVQQAGVVLDARSRPTHLAAWTQAAA